MGYLGRINQHISYWIFQDVTRYLRLIQDATNIIQYCNDLLHDLLLIFSHLISLSILDTANKKVPRIKKILATKVYDLVYQFDKFL